MDSLTVDIIDTSLHVADELIHTLPQGGGTEDWLYWAAGAVVTIIGIFVYYKKQKNAKK